MGNRAGVPDGKILSIRETVDAVYRSDSRRVLATLIRLLGDFDLAEEALQDAFATAMEQWQREGIPANPRTWLVSVGRFKAIDRIRRNTRLGSHLNILVDELDVSATDPSQLEDDDIEDERLRLIFTCCHPALSQEAQIVLTLRTVCGLTTEEIAHAFLTRPATIAQRIVRAKAKIREAHIPYEVPAQDELPGRLDAVLNAIYLVFNEGYSASSGQTLTRSDLSGEAIRLGRLLIELLPDPEAVGLLALMLIQESRRAARTSPQGDLIRLEDQDRTLWNHEQIEEGIKLVQQALSSGHYNSYALQAAMAAVHATAPSFQSTNWVQIIEYYDLLLKLSSSPVIELNRAVAVAMSDGPAGGLVLVDDILARGELADYHLAHSTRAELCRQLGRTTEARASYRRALELAQQEPERRFLERRLMELPD